MVGIHLSGREGMNWNPVFCGVWVRTKVRYLVHEVSSLPTHLPSSIPIPPTLPPPFSPREKISRMTQPLFLFGKQTGGEMPAGADKELKRANKVMILGQKKKKVIWNKLVREVSNSVQDHIYDTDVFTLQSLWK